MLLWTRHSPKSAAGASEIHPGFQHSGSGGEVERVLLYPRIQARYRITAVEAARFAESLADAADLVGPVIDRPVVVSDPADDSVLYTAVDGKADILCTRNIRHFASPEVRSFCAERGIRVMTDLEALRHLL